MSIVIATPSPVEWNYSVARVRRKLLRKATALVGPDDAEDVLQEALLKAWRLTKQTPRDWEGWLFRCLTNAARDWKRRELKLPEIWSLDRQVDDDNE